MKSIIEIGTGSVKFMMFDFTDGNINVIIDQQIITKLGEGYLKEGVISKPALKRTINVVRKCINTAKNKGCLDIHVFGTMILRSAINKQMVLSEIASATGVYVEVLTGDEEAKYSYLAASKTLNINPEETVLVVDSGGGSTEFIFAKGSEILYSESIDIGAVHLTEKFNLSEIQEAQTMLNCEIYANRRMSVLKKQYQSTKLIAIGGSATSVSAMIQELDPYDGNKIQGSTVNIDEISELQNKLASMDSTAREDIIGLSPKRSDIILGGVVILGCIIDRSNINEMIVCDRGLRYGLAYSLA